MSSSPEIRRSSTAVAPAEQQQQQQQQAPQVGKCQQLRTWMVKNPGKAGALSFLAAIVLLGIGGVITSAIQGGGFNSHSLDWLNKDTVGIALGAGVGTVIIFMGAAFGTMYYEIRRKEKEAEAQAAADHAASPDGVFEGATATGVPAELDGKAFDAPSQLDGEGSGSEPSSPASAAGGRRKRDAKRKPGGAPNMTAAKAAAGRRAAAERDGTPDTMPVRDPSPGARQIASPSGHAWDE